MNEEALKYSYELFTNDGYEGTIDQYKELINNNPEAFSHSYKLFKEDGYEGGEDDYKGLVISPPKEEAPKKEQAVSMESQLDSAQKAGDSELPAIEGNTDRETNIKVADNTSVGQEQRKEDPNMQGDDSTMGNVKEGVLAEIEAQKQEPNKEIVDLYESYKASGEITLNDEVEIAKKVADQKKGEGRSWWEKATAYTDGWLRTGLPIPLYKYDTEEGLKEKREKARKATFLQSLPNEKREELNNYAVNRTLELDSSSKNVLAENVMLEEKAKLLVKNIKHIGNAIKSQQESGKAVPTEMYEEYAKRKKEIDDISSKYNSNVDVIESNNEDIGNFVEELDLLKKNFKGIGYYKDLARLATADMLSGLMEFGVSTAELAPVAPGVPMGQSLPEAEKFIANFREETSRQRSFIKPPMSVEDINNSRDFGKWLAEQTMIQLPVMAVLIPSGGTNVGLGLLGMSSAGSKMGELKDYQTDLRTNIEKKKLEIAQMDGDTFIDPEVKAKALKELKALEDKPSYGQAEIYLAGVGNGLAEALSEKISLGILSKGKRVLTSSVKTELKMGVKQYVQEASNLIVGGGIDMSKEATSEFGNNLVQNAIDIFYLGNQDTHLFDNSLDVLASGGAMGAGMSMFPSLIGMGAKAFMGKDASDLMTQNSNKLTSLLEALEMGRDVLPEGTKKIMLDKVNNIIKEQDATLKEAFNRAKTLSKEDNAKLLKIDTEANKIIKAVQDIKSGGLTPTMQADLLFDLKAKRDKLINQKLEILGKAPMKLTDEETKTTKETTKPEETKPTEDTKGTTETGTTTDEGGEGGKGTQGEDGKKSDVDGDGKGVQPDSPRDKKAKELSDRRVKIDERNRKNKERRESLRGIIFDKNSSEEQKAEARKGLKETQEEKSKILDELVSLDDDFRKNERGRELENNLSELKVERDKVFNQIKEIEDKISEKGYGNLSIDEVKEYADKLDKLRKDRRDIDGFIKSVKTELSDLEGVTIDENGVDGKGKTKGTNTGDTAESIRQKADKLEKEIKELNDQTSEADFILKKLEKKASKLDKNSNEYIELKKEIDALSKKWRNKLVETNKKYDELRDLRELEKEKAREAAKERKAKEVEEKKVKDKRAKRKPTTLQEKKLKEIAPGIATVLSKVINAKASLVALAEVFPKDSPYYPLMQLIAKNKKNFSEITLRWATPKEVAEGSDGFYARSTQEIAINPKTRQAFHTIVHEAVHAVTVNAINKYLGYAPERMHGKKYIEAVEKVFLNSKNSKDPMEKAVGAFAGLYLETLEKTGRMDMAMEDANQIGMDMYGFTNLYEFVAEAFTNPKFQDVLNKVDSDVKVEYRRGSLYDKFVDAVNGILKALNNGKDIIKGNVLHNVIAISADIMKVNEIISPLSQDEILNIGDVKNVDEDAEDPKSRRERMEEEIDDMLIEGFSEEAIIKSFKTKKEQEIAMDIIERMKPATKDGSLKELNDTFDKAQKEMYETKGKSTDWGKAMRKLALWFFDRQYVPKMILKKAGLKLIRNYMITSKGASGYARYMYDEAYKKIYQTPVKVGDGTIVYDTLTTEDILTLDKIIMARRIMAIDKNRLERGMPTVVQTGFLNSRKAKLALEGLKDQMGEKKFNDMNKRADEYFKAFKELLGAMEESGLVSKQFAESFFEVDYQPKVYLDFLKTAEQEMSIIEMGAEESTSLASEQVRKLEEGSAGSLITDSRYLLSRSMNARAKAVAMNNTVSRLQQEMEAQAEVIKELKQKDKLSAKERRQIKYFNELSKAVRYNPITGFTKTGKPKYKYKTKGYKPQYFYRNGVRHMVLMEESFFDAFNDNVKGIWKNSNMKEQVSIYSLSGLVKTIATGNNPAFFITNAPRDFFFVATFSPVYGSVVPLNLAKVFIDTLKGIKDIRTKDKAYENFVKYGGMLDYLHKQGQFKGTNWLNKKLSTKTGKLFGLIGQSGKDRAMILGNWVSFKKLQMYSEIGIRMGVFNRAVKNQFRAIKVKNEQEFLDKKIAEGKTEQEAKTLLNDVYVNATAEARNTTDFSQGGIYAKDADALVPYLNAGIQGTRVAVEALGESPTGFINTTSKIVQSASILSILPLSYGIKMLGWLGDDEVPEEYKGLTATERYLKARKGVSRYDLTNYSVWFTGKFDANGEAHYIRVAKPHFLTPFITYAESLQLEVAKHNVGDTTPSTVIDNVKFALENNISPVEMSLTGTLARNPLFKAALTYTTGYDFYRDQDLSYLRGEVEIQTEGHESPSVEAFYKRLGEELEISPARMKGAAESLITTPSTSPFIGILYGGLDTMLADEDAKEAMKDTKNRLLKSISGRLSKTTSEFNRRINLKGKFSSEISKLEIYDIKNKAKFKDLTRKLIKGEISEDKLVGELVEVAKKSPFDAKRMANIIKSTAQNPQVSQSVWKIKFAEPKERAIYLAYIYGSDFLEEEKIMGKENKKLWRELLTNKAINKETIVEYEKLIGKRLPE
jgi:hypothetical protein